MPPSITVADLAKRLGAESVGDTTRTIDDIKTLDRAGPTDLSWFGDDRYRAQFESTGAGAVLVPTGCEIPGSKTVIVVEDPDLALCDILKLLGPPPDRVPPGVHASAIIAPDVTLADNAAIGAHVSVGAGARIGTNTQVHPGVRIGSDVTIGDDCVIWPNVVVRERVTVGDRVIIHPNCTFGADGFGYLQRGGRHVRVPQVGAIVIEDDVEIGANCCIDRARSGVTRIHRGTKIDNLVQVGHNCEIGEDAVIVAQTGISGSVRIGDRVMIGGHAGISDHVTIGADARIIGMSGVQSDVPAGKTMRGQPVVDNNDFRRQFAAQRKLPQLLAQFRELQKRVERLESAAND